MSKLIVLDPGHGQYGNQYPAAKGFYEGTQMFKLANKLKALLELRGFTVLVTRTKISDDPSLAVRGKLAGNNKADIFISLHSNAVSSIVNENVYGVDVFYSLTDKDNLVFADNLGNAVAKVMDTEWRGSKIRESDSTPGVDYYGVLRNSATSGCKRAFIIEHGFHTSTKDAKFLIDDSCLDKLAEVECKVICEYFKVDYDLKPIMYVLHSSVDGYPTAEDAKNDKNSIATLVQGIYYVYNKYRQGYQGMLNVTTDKTGDTSGFWINPKQNILQKVYRVRKEWQDKNSQIGAFTVLETAIKECDNYIGYKVYNDYGVVVHTSTKTEAVVEPEPPKFEEPCCESSSFLNTILDMISNFLGSSKK